MKIHQNARAVQTVMFEISRKDKGEAIQDLSINLEYA